MSNTNIYEIQEYVEAEGHNNPVPLLSIPMMSEFKEHLLTLQCCKKHPEFYEPKLNEVIAKTICNLEATINQATEKELEIYRALVVEV